MPSPDSAGGKPALLQRIKASTYWRYRTIGWRWWWKEWRSTALQSLREEVGMAVAGTLLAAASRIASGYTSWDAIDWIDATSFGLIGGFATLFAFLFLTAVWQLLQAPHRVWAVDQEKVAELQAARTTIDALTATLEDERRTAARLSQRSNDLDEERRRLQAELDAKRQLELIPASVPWYEFDSISILPIHLDAATPECPNLEATAVWGTISNIVIVNNDEHPTTLRRLWLRVIDPTTGAELVPLPKESLGADHCMPMEESFGPSFAETFITPPLIAARSQIKVAMRHRAYYPGRFPAVTTEDKRRMVSLCAAASGLATSCCTLGEEYFTRKKPAQ